MIADELMLKLGIDQSQVAQGLESFKQKVAAAAGSTQKSFIKAGSEARTFKKIIEDLTANSPALGTALRFALNPIVGIMAGGVMMIHKFIDAEKKATEEAGKLADAIGRQRVEMIGATYSKDPQAARRAAALEYAKGQAGESLSSFQDKARKELEARERKGSSVTMTPEGPIRTAGPLFTEQDVRDLALKLREAAVARYQAMLRDNKVRSQETDEHEREVERLKIRARNYQREDAERQKVEADRLKAEKDYVERLKGIAKEQAQRTKRAKGMAESYADQYRPDLDTLSRYNTGIGGQARYIQWLERGATNQFAMGDIVGAKETIFGAGGVKQLKDQLVNAGILRRDAGEVLEAMTDGKGNLKVNIIEGAE